MISSVVRRPVGDGLRQLARDGGDRLAPAVGQRQAQRHAAVAGRIAHQRVQRLLRERGQPVHLADGDEADVVVHDLVALFDDVVAQKLHQRRDLLDGALPVLRRERVQRQRPQAHLARGANHLAHGLGALAVTLDARQAVLLSPAAVAVHDDRHVAGKLGGIDHSAGLGYHKQGRLSMGL